MLSTQSVRGDRRKPQRGLRQELGPDGQGCLIDVEETRVQWPRGAVSVGDAQRVLKGFVYDIWTLSNSSQGNEPLGEIVTEGFRDLVAQKGWRG